MNLPSTVGRSAAWPAGPSPPPEPGAEVHLWRVELDSAGWPGAEGLPAEDGERATAMLRPDSARRWLASRWALRLVLGRYLDQAPAAVALATGEFGKPALAEGPDRLEFNLSHSGGLALVAVASEREVGVDVERIDTGRNLVALAERELGAEEAAAVRGAIAGERAAAFYAAWTRREAIAKCFGGGLGNPAPTDPVAVENLDPGDGYAAALAIAGSGPMSYRRYSIAPEVSLG